MKKTLFLTLALMSGASIYALQEGAFISADLSSIGVTSSSKTLLPAQTVLCKSEHAALKNAYECNVKQKSEVFYKGAAVDGVPYTDTGTGVCGEYDVTGVGINQAPTAGWVFRIDVTKDGWITLFGEFNSNKAYYVFEGENGNAHLIGHEFHYSNSSSYHISSYYYGEFDKGHTYTLPGAEGTGYFNMGLSNASVYSDGTNIRTVQDIVYPNSSESLETFGYGCISFPVSAEVGTYMICASQCGLNTYFGDGVPGIALTGFVLSDNEPQSLLGLGERDCPAEVEFKCPAVTNFGIQYEYTDNTHTAWKVTGTEWPLPMETTIPSYIDGLPVTHIEKISFGYLPWPIHTLTLPETITSIDEGSFASIAGVYSTIDMSKTQIEEIPPLAFSSSTFLNCLKLPATLKAFRHDAFAGMAGLSELYMYSSDPAAITIEENAFGWSESPSPVYVPYGTKSRYASAPYWGDEGKYINIVEMTPESYSFYIEDTQVIAEQVTLVPVVLMNESGIKGMQCDIHLPQGVRLATDEYGEPYIERSELTAQHDFGMNFIDGCWRITCTNIRNQQIPAGAGVLFYIPVVAEDIPGTLHLGIDNIYVALADNQSQSIAPASGILYIEPAYICGDADGDRTVTVADFTLAIDYILGKPTEGFNFRASDVDGDGKLLIGDATAIIDMLLHDISSTANITARAPRKTSAACTFGMVPLTCEYGVDTEISITLTNTEAIRDIQFNFTLPAGFTVGSDNYGFYGNAVDRARRHSCDIVNNNGIYTVAVTSTSGYEIPAGEGIVVTIPLTVTAADGEYTVDFSNVIYSNPNRVDCPAFSGTITVGNGSQQPDSFSLVDGQAYDNDRDYTGVSVTYSRNFKNTNWQGFYVPFNMPYEEWSKYGTVAELNNVHQYDEDNDGVLETIKIEYNRVTGGELVPNRPYVFKAHTPVNATFSCQDATLKASEEGSVDCASTHYRYVFTGIYHDKTDMHSSGAYALNGGVYSPASSDAAVLKPFRFFLTITPRSDNYTPSTGLPSKIGIVVDGEECGIDDLEIDFVEENVYYDLLGRKVKEPAHGIFITNGKVIKK